LKIVKYLIFYLLLILLIFSVYLAFQINETKFKVQFFSPYNCDSCEKVLKNAFFQSSEFEVFLKNISWIKTAEKTKTSRGTEFFIEGKKPLFKISSHVYYDENFEPFFSLNEHNKIILNTQNKDLPSSAKQQAILISNSELREKIKSLSFNEAEGWVLDFDDYKVLLGKKELQARLKKIIKLTNKINKKDLKNNLLDLRYPKGFVIKNL
tara:strand:- start:1 stop:627 length:627 start_codon:yes stop_codon:yes gene_type:complete